MKLYIDTETCGLYGMPVLLQYAFEDGPIQLYEIWKHPIGETLDLIESFLPHTIVGFNLTFDWFQIVKLWTIFRLCPRDWIPERHIDEIAAFEVPAQDGPCIKPASALDLLLHSRKGPYQSLMARDDIRIKRVPACLAQPLADELERRVEIDGIYFARTKDKDAPRWKVFERKSWDGAVDPDFKDVVLKFNAAGGLKFLAEHALKLKPTFHFADVEPPTDYRPIEYGYAPYAAAVSTERNWGVYEEGKLIGYAWPGVIWKHIEHWHSRPDAREYAKDDIVYTRKLDEFFGFPTPGDNDSILACMVPVVRWRGFQINLEGIKKLLAEAESTIEAAPINVNKPTDVRAYLFEMLDENEQLHLSESTGMAKLEPMKDWNVGDEECLKCQGKGCIRCYGGRLIAGKHPVVPRVQAIIEVKFAVKRRDLCKKLLHAKKLHASFNVIGAKSARMSGADGLNPQGIDATDEVRSQFPLAWEGFELCGGDFDGYEVTLADAVFGDERLRQDLTTLVPCDKCQASGLCRSKKCKECGGTEKHACMECLGKGQITKKIHALFAMALNPGKSYEDIIATKQTKEDLYDEGKKGFFGGILYMGGWETLVGRLGKTESVAKAAYEEFSKRYPKVKAGQELVKKRFQCVWQPGGIGTLIKWKEPAPYAESFLGFRRDFTLENKICRALFDLAQRPPQSWRNTKVKVCRRDRVQTAAGAVSSALYGAVFAMSGATVRAAGNHYIQSPGGEIAKAVQRAIWDIQPVGIHEMIVAPFNVHDEIDSVTDPEYVDAVADSVVRTVESYRKHVPLIGMAWYKSMANWGQKKAGAAPVMMAA